IEQGLTFFSNAETVKKDMKESSEKEITKAEKQETAKNNKPDKSQTAKQKALIKAADDSYKKAKNQTDQDVVSFLKNQTIKSLTEGKIDEEVIKEYADKFDTINVNSSKEKNPLKETDMFANEDNNKTKKESDDDEEE